MCKDHPAGFTQRQPGGAKCFGAARIKPRFLALTIVHTFRSIPVVSLIAMKSVREGAATQCYVSAHPDAASINGEYFVDCNVARSSRDGSDEAMADRLWEVTEEIVAKL